MLVYTDVFTSEEVISDSYKQIAPFGCDDLADVAFEVISRRVAKGNEDYGISANVDEDAEEGATAESGGAGAGSTVVDIVDKFGLEEYAMNKNDFKAYIKGYMAKLVAHLSSAKANRVNAFKEGTGKLVKKVLEEWDNCQIFLGPNYQDHVGDCKVLPIIAYYKGDETEPRFIYLRDGLKEVKC